MMICKSLIPYVLSFAINRIIQGWQQEQNIAPQGSNHLSSLCQIIQLIPTPFQVHSVIYLKAKARTARKSEEIYLVYFFHFFMLYIQVIFLLTPLLFSWFTVSFLEVRIIGFCKLQLSPGLDQEFHNKRFIYIYISRCISLVFMIKET